MNKIEICKKEKWKKIEQTVNFYVGIKIEQWWSLHILHDFVSLLWFFMDVKEKKGGGGGANH